MSHHQGFHSGHFQDNPIKPHNLERCQPRVRAGLSNHWYLNDRTADGKNKVQQVVPMPEEVAPIGEFDEETDDDLNVEKASDDQFTKVQNALVRLRHIRRTGRLQNYRSEGECHPDVTKLLVPFLHVVIPRQTGCIGRDINVVVVVANRSQTKIQ